MLKELLSIFRHDNPLASMADRFTRMLVMACDMTGAAGDIYFGKGGDSESQSDIYKKDVEVNKLERSIRKRVVTHVTMGAKADLPYCLLLLGLVKDVERLGDYAKNLTEVRDLFDGALPDGELVSELREIRAWVDYAMRSAADVFTNSDREVALTLIREGRDHARRADALLAKIAHSKHPSDVTTALVLGSRYYKRMGGHVLNVLSSVVMPLHKVDYYDEDEIEAEDDS